MARFEKGHKPYKIMGIKNPNWKGGIANKNKKETSMRWHKENPDKVRNYNLVKNFGITIEQYRQMEKDQNGVCLICKQVENTLHVDHNHDTGEIRGLLCGRCNRGLGMFRDNTLLLLEAIKYLDSK